MDSSPLITDWIQAGAFVCSLFISSAGIYYIRKTLILQNAINEAQLKMIDIEKRRAAREIRPTITVKYLRGEEMPVTAVPSPFSYINVFYIKCEENEALNVCIEYSRGEIKGFGMRPGESIGLLRSGSEYEFKVHANHILDGDIYFRVHYQDIDGLPYYNDYMIYRHEVKNVKLIATPHTSVNIFNNNLKIQV